MKREFFVAKTEEDAMLVFGWGSVAVRENGEQVEDAEGDQIDPGDLEKAAYDHVLRFRSTGERHDPTLRHKGRLVESCVFTREKQEALGIPPGIVPEGWWVGYQIDDPVTWKKIKSGEYAMFSIEGIGEREPIRKKHTRVAKTFGECYFGKFNPYHDPKNGRFTSHSGGNSVLRVLTDDDISAINQYISSKSYIINEMLRNGEEFDESEQLWIKKLDAALEKMPCYQGGLSRSLEFYDTETLREFLEEHTVGNTVRYKAYTSTTKGEIYNPKGQVLVIIEDSKHGKDISMINKGEQEVLYPRNARFYVESRHLGDNNEIIIKLKEI